MSSMHGMGAGMGFSAGGGPPLPVVTLSSRAFGSTLGGFVPFYVDGLHLEAAQLKINGTNVGAQTILSPTRIQVDLEPALAAGVYDITATSPAGTSLPLVNAYEAMVINGWYHADWIVLASGKVATELDCSGGGFDFVQGAAGSRPLVIASEAALNNRQCVHYTASAFTIGPSKSQLKCLWDGTGGALIDSIIVGNNVSFAELGLGIAGTFAIVSAGRVNDYPAGDNMAYVVGNGLAAVILAFASGFGSGVKSHLTCRYKTGATPAGSILDSLIEVATDSPQRTAPSSADSTNFPVWGAGNPAGSFPGTHKSAEKIITGFDPTPAQLAKIIAWKVQEFGA